MKLSIILTTLGVLISLTASSQSGQWGNCEFATVAAMNAFDPSSSNYDCKRAFVQASNEHYHWNGSAWVTASSSTDDQTIETFSLSGTTLSLAIEDDGQSDQTVDLSGINTNIYSDNGTLAADRTISMGGNNITFDGSGDVIIEDSGDVGIGTTSPDAKLDVENGSVRFSDYGAGTYKDNDADYLIGTQSDGDLVELNIVKSAKFFYAPSITLSISATSTGSTLDLYDQYYDQFGSPMVASTSAPSAIPYYSASELYYYVTHYDNTIFDNVSIDANGLMTYDVIAVPTDNYSQINVVFVVK